MIAYLKGRLIRKSIDYIVVEVQGVGYKVYVTGSLQSKLPKIGEELELHTYNYVREDSITLYGFALLEELNLFEQLLGVSKIGPKASLSILATLTVEEFKLAIINGEVDTLKKVKGVGNKTAKRLILELQGKVELDKIVNDNNSTVDDDKINDSIDALVNLGYAQNNARKVVIDIYQQDSDLAVQEIIKMALGYLS